MTRVSRLERATTVPKVRGVKASKANQESKAIPAGKRSETRKAIGSSRDQLVRSFRCLGINYQELGMSSETTVQSRLKSRLQQRERRRQDNLERIFKQALDFAPDKMSGDELDLDWLQSFVAQAEDISNPSMQKLWAKILASESARPGSFSLRSITTLRQLTSREADVLRRAQGLTAYDPLHLSYKIITGYYRRPSLFTYLTLDKPVQLNIARAGLSYPDLLTLSQLDIMYPSTIESGELTKGQSIKLNYGEKVLELTAQRRGLVMTYHKFTAQGEELLKLIPSAPQTPYLGLVEDHFSRDFSLSVR
ncbi:TIGR03899 family protein [Aliidiomarina sedimenti]|uniref:TIGR03899 family protein n=1 Tax=Aliidiomarina sedimenti TaxID=1933879 RepID=A0ABY0BUS2_9GAMM|nr:TIGR03899 family protein [Aliidiomarina sedimenti]RUO27944.1 TIGR03899 family protein [Aliidiomarina sedimenti]